MTILIDLQYLPCLEFFSLFKNSNKIIIETAEHYIKQSYRNRCHIQAANKIDALSVPVRGGNSKVKIKDAAIDYGQRWLNDHWRAIMSSYGKSPFFEHYEKLFHDILFHRHKYLFDLNWELLSLCLDFLEIDTKIEFSSGYQSQSVLGTEDLRSIIHPKRHYEKNDFYRPCRYGQVFGKNFAPNLSIIDLLFCEGSNARSILKRSTVKKTTIAGN